MSPMPPRFSPVPFSAFPVSWSGRRLAAFGSAAHWVPFPMNDRYRFRGDLVSWAGLEIVLMPCSRFLLTLSRPPISLIAFPVCSQPTHSGRKSGRD
jgi:hypothetical protein